MKLFKRLAVIFTAVVMSFSVFALVACNKPTPEEESKAEGDKIVEQLSKSPVETISLSANLGMTEGKKDYAVDGSGNKTLIEDSVKSDTMSGKVYVDADLFGGDMDTVFVTTEGNESYYEYGFIRGWNLFDVIDHDGKQITDFSEVELTHVIDVEEFLTDYGAQAGLTAKEVKDIFGEAVTMLLPEFNNVLISLATANGAFTADDGYAEIDLNKMAYAMVTKLVAAIDKLTVDSTLEEILKEDNFAAALSPIINLIPAEDLQAILNELGIKVSPDEGSTTYQYLVKLVTSKEINDFIDSILKEENISMPCALKDIELGFILNAFGISQNQEEALDGLKEMVKEYVKGITETEFAMSFADGEGSEGIFSFSLTEAKVSFEYDEDYKITNQKMSAEFDMLSGYTMNYGGDKTYREQTYKVEFDCEITFPPVEEIKSGLSNINDCKVYKVVEVPAHFVTGDGEQGVSGTVTIYNANTGDGDTQGVYANFVLRDAGYGEVELEMIRFSNPIDPANTPDHKSQIRLEADDGLLLEENGFLTTMTDAELIYDGERMCYAVVFETTGVEPDTFGLEAEFRFVIYEAEGYEILYENTVSGVLNGTDFIPAA